MGSRSRCESDFHDKCSIAPGTISIEVVTSARHFLQHQIPPYIVTCNLSLLLTCSFSPRFSASVSWPLWPRVTDSAEVSVLSSHQQRTLTGIRYLRGFKIQNIFHKCSSLLQFSAGTWYVTRKFAARKSSCLTNNFATDVNGVKSIKKVITGDNLRYQHIKCV